MMTDREKLVEMLESHCAVIGEEKCKAVKEEICSPRDCAGCLADHLLANGVTVQRWRDAKTDPPELPDKDFCHIVVCATFPWSERSEPRYYERTVIRDKRVERWKYIAGRIAPTPDKWQPLPEPPKEG